MVNCDVVKDLIPLVNDDVASEESKKLVNSHCENCSDCRTLLTNEPGCQPKDEKNIKSLKKSGFNNPACYCNIWYIDWNLVYRFK